MNTRLRDIPVYASTQTEVSAEHFNLARVALKRLKTPFRLQLPKLRTLDLILEEDAWIVVDRSLNDVPILAWLEFDVHQRGLHEPVACRLNLYHTHGRLIIGKVLEAMALLIGEQLVAAGIDEGTVIRFGDRS